MENFIFEKLPEFDNHEFISFFADKKTGLKGFIVLYNTNIGPAAGGTRYWHYSSSKEALQDALRLSKALAYKSALAGISFGGGKGIIIADSKKPKSRKLLQEYTKRVNLLKGNFYTGEDVGISKEDVRIMTEHSPFILGRVKLAGDSAFWTALGVFMAIQTGLEIMFGNSEIRGRTFAIKGLGKTGSELCRLIYERGGKIFGADIDSKKVLRMKRKFPNMQIVLPKIINTIKTDVYCPCALGGDFQENNIKKFQCKIICGSANNQLENPMCGVSIYKKGILYIPDYLANSGGLIAVTAELDKNGFERKKVEKRIKALGEAVKEIFNLSQRENKPTNVIADRLAESKLKIKKHGIMES